MDSHNMENNTWEEYCRWLDQLPCNNDTHFVNMSEACGVSSVSVKISSTSNLSPRPFQLTGTNKHMNQRDSQSNIVAIHNNNHTSNSNSYWQDNHTEWSIMPFASINGGAKRNHLHIQELKREPHNIFLRPLYNTMPQSMQQNCWENPKLDASNVQTSADYPQHTLTPIWSASSQASSPSIKTPKNLPEQNIGCTPSLNKKANHSERFDYESDELDLHELALQDAEKRKRPRLMCPKTLLTEYVNWPFISSYT
ncbi:hypothetical protein BDF19DRAFT_451202 [Syncephalis fuscata]|nr:hypothetical protein BDF19DRAFT_451202 [Syncephalis fuscata]